MKAEWTIRTLWAVAKAARLAGTEGPCPPPGKILEACREACKDNGPLVGSCEASLFLQIYETGYVVRSGNRVYVLDQMEDGTLKIIEAPSRVVAG